VLFLGVVVLIGLCTALVDCGGGEVAVGVRVSVREVVGVVLLSLKGGGFWL